MDGVVLVMEGLEVVLEGMLLMMCGAAGCSLQMRVRVCSLCMMDDKGR